MRTLKIVHSILLDDLSPTPNYRENLIYVEKKKNE